MSVVITAENISKLYRLGVLGTSSLRQDLHRWWVKMIHGEDPVSKVGNENVLSQRGGDYIWALQDINFEVRQGEVLGIIGKNGAGKSTLLKILTKITAPTTGRVKIKGRVASLLEVGTGFHPDLTGRENLYLNGAILGMTKAEIRAKFDEIVEFSGVEKYIDTPVKRYSSGMYVRLAFAIAAHLEPEILIIDEVLAVGDAEFQRKCLGKMKDVSSGEGRTILFVSHNMEAIRNLCSDCIYLKEGKIFIREKPETAVQQYLEYNYTFIPSESIIHRYDDNIGKVEYEIIKPPDENKNKEVVLYVNQNIDIRIEYEVLGKALNPRAYVNIYSIDDVLITSSICDKVTDGTPGIYEAVFRIPANFLNNMRYKINIGIATFSAPAQIHVYIENALIIDVLDSPDAVMRQFYKDRISGLLRVDYNWELKKR